MEMPVQQQIPVDPSIMEEDDEIDSTMGDDESMRRSVASLTDSVLQHRELHGRTYQVSKTTDYWGPNDTQQMEGLDLTHHWMSLLLDGKMFLAPIAPNPQRVLDVGTGTGIWAIDFADEHPSADVIGTDISPMQPSWVPPNCHFIIEDAQLNWSWPQNHFDYIHMRHLTGCIDDWGKAYAQAFDHTKPGGFFEHCEYDIQPYSDLGPLPDDHILRRWSNNLAIASKKSGREFVPSSTVSDMGEALRTAGFVDVVHRIWKVPIGGWAADMKMKQLGLFTLEFVDTSLEGFGLKLLREVEGWEYDEVQDMIRRVRRAFRWSKLRTYFFIHIAYGRKP